MKNLILMLIVLISSINLNAQEDEYFTSETCYCKIVLSNTTYAKRTKTLIKTTVFEVPCPVGTQEVILFDLKMQFFHFLHHNYRKELEIFKGDITSGMLKPFVRESEKEVVEVVSKGYNNDYWKKLGYHLIIVDDFKYEKGKFSSNKYSREQLYKMFLEMDDFFVKGKDLE